MLFWESRSLLNVSEKLPAQFRANLNYQIDRFLKGKVLFHRLFQVFQIRLFPVLGEFLETNVRERMMEHHL